MIDSAAMPTLAFLTMSDPTGFDIDDHLCRAPLEAAGWQLDEVPWDRPGVRWADYALVVIRSPWDYHHRHEEFLAVLEDIVRQGGRLENDLGLVRWNLRKTYLRELEARGVPVVPTVWRDGLEAGGLLPLFDAVGADEIVVKPEVGASADGAWRLTRDRARELADEIEAFYAGRPLMAQPLVPSVVEEGEWSLITFRGEPSHALLKTPTAGDFRVQEEHGGLLTPGEPEASLRAASDTVLGALDVTPLYARVDVVRRPDGGGWWLMELELIEPALYLRLDEGAPARFARALVERAEEAAAGV